MFRIFSLAAILAATVYGGQAEVQIEEGVLVLTTDNFNEVIEGNEFVLVEFYAPWCGHCKKLAPEYAKAAQALAAEDSNIKLAKVDATEHAELGSRFNVKGYPTLKFFKDGDAGDYSGGRTESTITSWLKKHTGPPAVTLNSVEDAEKLLKEQVAVIGFFKGLSTKAQDFLKVASKNDELQFGITSEDALFKEYNVEKEGIVLFKKFDELRNELVDEDITAKQMVSFISANSVPLFTEFTAAVSQTLFSKKDKPFLFVVMSKESDQFESIKEIFTNVAKEYRNSIRIVFINTDDKNSARIATYIGAPDTQEPTYRIMNFATTFKYKPENSEITEEAVADFIDRVAAGQVKAFLKSQNIPEDWDAQPVKVLVGKNFKEVALDPTKHVLVEFYAPWCGHCKKLTAIWDELGEKFADRDDIIIAKLDSTENEIEEVVVKGFPTIKFFPAVQYTKPVDYSGGRTLDDFVKYLDKQAPAPKKNKFKKDQESNTSDEKESEKKEDAKEAKKDKDEL